MKKVIALIIDSLKARDVFVWGLSALVTVMFVAAITLGVKG